MLTNEQRLRNLQVPSEVVDVVLDTDAFNEIDDQFAIAYLLRSQEKLCTKALYAAPFFNANSTSPEDGMEKSYAEIVKLLGLLERSDVPVFEGSRRYLPDEDTAVDSPAARDLAARAAAYSPEHPLYVVAIGAITNVASALLLAPAIADNIVVVWLGGHSRMWHDNNEFNCSQDVAAARVVFGSGAPLVQLPCMGVVSGFTVTEPELRRWLVGTTPIADYLARNTIAAAESYAAGTPWSRVIWDVTAVAWLLGGDGRFMLCETCPTPELTYDHRCVERQETPPMRRAYHIHTDELKRDLFTKLTQ